MRAIWSPVTEAATYAILEEGSSSNVAPWCRLRSPMNVKDQLLWFLIEGEETDATLVLVVLSFVDTRTLSASL